MNPIESGRLTSVAQVRGERAAREQRPIQRTAPAAGDTIGRRSPAPHAAPAPAEPPAYVEAAYANPRFPLPGHVLAPGPIPAHTLALPAPSLGEMQAIAPYLLAGPALLARDPAAARVLVEHLAFRLLGAAQPTEHTRVLAEVALQLDRRDDGTAGWPLRQFAFEVHAQGRGLSASELSRALLALENLRVGGVRLPAAHTARLREATRHAYDVAEIPVLQRCRLATAALRALAVDALEGDGAFTARTIAMASANPENSAEFLAYAVRMATRPFLPPL